MIFQPSNLNDYWWDGVFILNWPTQVYPLVMKTALLLCCGLLASVWPQGPRASDRSIRTMVQTSPANKRINTKLSLLSNWEKEQHTLASIYDLLQPNLYLYIVFLLRRCQCLKQNNNNNNNKNKTLKTDVTQLMDILGVLCEFTINLIYSSTCHC